MIHRWQMMLVFINLQGSSLEIRVRVVPRFFENDKELALMNFSLIVLNLCPLYPKIEPLLAYGVVEVIMDTM